MMYGKGIQRLLVSRLKDHSEQATCSQHTKKLGESLFPFPFQFKTNSHKQEKHITHRAMQESSRNQQQQQQRQQQEARQAMDSKQFSMPGGTYAPPFANREQLYRAWYLAVELSSATYALSQ